MSSTKGKRGPLRDYVRGTLGPDELVDLASTVDIVVEARGTFCPEPVIRTQKAVAEAAIGQTAMVVADDAGIEVDLPAWCMSHRHEYLGVLREPKLLRAFVRKR